ncbi:hypothetical protein [Chryseolinea soli]|uniref:Uncharacterized protein n=1 Tax=Chryseolinea soli TaxID=2321403 RepID=A0A385SGY0_9BACT|nr:hypothetical protein [Chryseolinea soli]AYB29155.1 hypothetical protein D4L85_00510 [Chryseolinea soli]
MKKIIFILLLGSVAVSCKKSTETTESATVTADTSETSTAFDAQRKMFFNNLMAPAEVAAQIQFTAAEFNPKLMSDPKSFVQYTGNEVKAAANLGVYLSDLNYSIAYKQAKTTKEYFGAAHELSKAIGGEKRVLEFLMKRYNDNIAQNDSVKSVVTDLLQKSTSQLQGTDKEKLAGIAMAAYQIENLHLVLGTLESYPKDMLPGDARTVILVPLFKVALNQRANVQNIYNFLKTYSDPNDPDKNPNYPYYANAFEELIGVYQKLNVEEKIASNKGLEIMNDAVVKELSEKVNAIRNKIVSPT